MKPAIVLRYHTYAPCVNWPFWYHLYLAVILFVLILSVFLDCECKLTGNKDSPGLVQACVLIKFWKFLVEWLEGNKMSVTYGVKGKLICS